MRTTILASAAALVIGAGLVYLLMPEPPSPPTCKDIAGDPPHRASVNVNWNPQAESCYLHTVPQRLHTCVDDELIWEVHPGNGVEVFAAGVQTDTGSDQDLHIWGGSEDSGDQVHRPFRRAVSRGP